MINILPQRKTASECLLFFCFYHRILSKETHKGATMSDIERDDFLKEMDEEMTVSLDLEDGTTVVCSIITILTVDGKDYIALQPLDDEGNAASEDVWFYGYKEDESDPNKDPELIYIESDEELEAVYDKFDEYLDDLEFDEE